MRSIGKLRSMVREMLAEELREIDGLVREMFEKTSEVFRHACAGAYFVTISCGVGV